MKKPSLVFHVIGFKAVGLGHIYRSLSLAQDLTDFQISFACTKSSFEMVELMIKEKYHLHLFDEETVYSDIRDLNPDIVINDVLSTNEDDIKTLKTNLDSKDYDKLLPSIETQGLVINNKTSRGVIIRGYENINSNHYVYDKIIDFCLPEVAEMRRQDLKPDAYIRSGSIYALTRDHLMLESLRYGSENSRPYILPSERAVNVDTEIDFLVAEKMIDKNATVQIKLIDEKKGY